jgi:uncharacterized integral membrane protein (TIGR00698 family)
MPQLNHFQGLVFALALSLVAYTVNYLGVKLSSIVIALILGVILHPFAKHEPFQEGFNFAAKKLLRYAIALLGLRVSLADIEAISLAHKLLIVFSMVATVVFTFIIGKLLKVTTGFAGLTGAANAVCGASATLATASVVPDYKDKSRDIAFVVIMANAISTLVMVTYPLIGQYFQFEPQVFGIFLGATIHDMAQVVGAGYAQSPEIGNNATIVKLLRVILLLPMVLAIGLYLNRATQKVEVPAPIFAYVFIILCVVNSFMPTALMPFFLPVKAFLLQVSFWLMLVSIAAMGLQTSFLSILTVGWRGLSLFLSATLFMLIFIIVGILWV